MQDTCCEGSQLKIWIYTLVVVAVSQSGTRDNHKGLSLRGWENPNFPS